MNAVSSTEKGEDDSLRANAKSLSVSVGSSDLVASAPRNDSIGGRGLSVGRVRCAGAPANWLRQYCSCTMTIGLSILANFWTVPLAPGSSGGRAGSRPESNAS